MRKRRAEEVKSWPNVRGSIPDIHGAFFIVFFNHFLYTYSYYGYGFMDQLTDGSAYSGMVTPSERVILGQIKNRSVSRKKK